MHKTVMHMLFWNNAEKMANFVVSYIRLRSLLGNHNKGLRNIIWQNQ